MNICLIVTSQIPILNHIMSLVQTIHNIMSLAHHALTHIACLEIMLANVHNTVELLIWQFVSVNIDLLLAAFFFFFFFFFYVHFV